MSLNKNSGWDRFLRSATCFEVPHMSVVCYARILSKVDSANGVCRLVCLSVECGTALLHMYVRPCQLIMGSSTQAITLRFPTARCAEALAFLVVGRDTGRAMVVTGEVGRQARCSVMESALGCQVSRQLLMCAELWLGLFGWGGGQDM
jgi:hypothetical protein